MENGKFVRDVDKFMKIKSDTSKLYKVIIPFYDLTGIRTVIFDADYNEVLDYPPQKCPFCKDIRKKEDLKKLCLKSDADAFNECTKRDDIYIYKCHAGLVEAVMPLKNNSKIIGYIMFGQITDIKDKGELARMAEKINKKYDINCNISGIKYKSRRQIVAAAKILEICTDYILQKEIIKPENNKIISDAKEYIKNNLANDIRVNDICAYCGCGRTRLYEMFKAECGCGIARYTNEKRLENARRLLKTTALTVAEISSACGFCDYNYFSRVYKKKYGISPGKEERYS